MNKNLYPSQPALNQITTLEQAFDLLNKSFFDNKLPHVMINQQSKKSDGYFSAFKWKSKAGADSYVHEINLAPSSMNRTGREILATLLHQMVHLWQYSFGTPPRRGYHNKEWADKMIFVGLMPFAIGNPGKMTGQCITHRIIEGGPFDMLAMETAIEIKYYAEKAGGLKKKKKCTYTCPACSDKLWGKPGVMAACRRCGVDFIEKQEEEAAGGEV